MSTGRPGILKPNNSTPLSKLMKPTSSWLEKTKNKLTPKKTTENTPPSNLQRNNSVRKSVKKDPKNTGAIPRTPVTSKPSTSRQPKSASRSGNQPAQPPQQKTAAQSTSGEDSGFNTPCTASTPDLPPRMNINLIESHLSYLLKQVQKTELTVREYNRVLYEEASEENQYLTRQLEKKDLEIGELHAQIGELKFKLANAEAIFSSDNDRLDNEKCPSFVQNGDSLIQLFEIVGKLHEDYATTNQDCL